MNESFRLSRSILVIGIVCTSIFLAAVIGFSALFFLEEPEKRGFNDPHAVAILGGLGIALSGSMTVLGAYVLLAYYVECFSVDGTTIIVRSVFQNRRFEPFEVERLVWKTKSRAGSIRFHVLNQTTKLDLGGYRSQDRLRIIRLVRALVPENRQEGWPLFCERVALPLREGVHSTGPTFDPWPNLPAHAMVEISRKRYDRQFLVAFPLFALAALALWWFVGLPQFFALPLLIIPFWLLLRLITPRQGERQPRVTATFEGRVHLLVWSVVVTGAMVGTGLRWAGFNADFVCWVIVALLAPLVPIVVNRAWRTDQLRRSEAISTSASANTR